MLTGEEVTGRPAWIIAEALAEAGWNGPVEVTATGPLDDPRIHVRWDGRHVEAVSVEAAAAFIRADAAEKRKQAILAKLATFVGPARESMSGACGKFGCTNAADGEHPCPFNSEINHDETPCFCCSECTSDCVMEI